MTLEHVYFATGLRFDHHPDGFGIGNSSPSLSWRFPTGDEDRATKNWQQKSYVVEVQPVVPGPSGLESSQPAVRSHVTSCNTVMNPWPAPPLESRQIALVRVAGLNTTKKGSSERTSVESWADWKDLSKENRTDWQACFSSPANPLPENTILGGTLVEAGLLRAEDWKAKFITSPDGPPPDGVPHRPTIYRKKFTYDAKANAVGAYARLYISSLGLYEVYVNGRRVGDHHMAPGWTSYHHRVQYQTYDVTSLLEHGQNVIAVEVAEGWYAGRLLWLPGLRNLYGDKPGFIAQLEIHGHKQNLMQIVSDDSWVCHPSPRVSASIYDGEAYDARQEVSGWSTSELKDESSWKKAQVLDFDFHNDKLVATDAPPVRVTQIVEPINVFKSPSGKTLVDFGQNLVGRVEIRGIQKDKGHSIKIRHAEVLENGELGVRPLRDAKATDEYTFSGKESEGADWSWSPQFTFHGFRYIDLEGWSVDDDEPPSTKTLSAVVVGSDMPRTGHFKCSNALVNKLHENVTWSMRGNFLSVPTDCPQRDERLGWTGDIQAFAPTASFLYASAGFLTNWLRDLAIDQADKGGVVPVVIPDVLKGRSNENDSPVAVWDDAAILVPWTLYQWHGDVTVLKRQWDSMEAHIHKSIRRGPDGLWDDSLFQFGDWLDPNAPPEQADLARTDGTLVADAYLVHVTDLMAQIAVAVGDAAAARSYQAEFTQVKKAFADKYITKAGLVVSDSQCGLALAICFDLLDTSEQLAAAGVRLARLVRQSRFKVSTGFAGTPLVLHALTKTDHLDLAYGMLLEKECPSWLYPVTMGATTIWERWDSMLPDGRINPGSMTSFNHYALGSVADWLHTVVGGVETLEPGWKTFTVRPRPGGELTHVEVSFESPHGRLGVAWNVVDSGETPGKSVFKMKVEVPPNAKALVILPGQKDEEGEWKGSGMYELECEMK